MPAAKNAPPARNRNGAYSSRQSYDRFSWTAKNRKIGSAAAAPSAFTASAASRNAGTWRNQKTPNAAHAAARARWHPRSRQKKPTPNRTMPPIRRASSAVRASMIANQWRRSINRPRRPSESAGRLFRARDCDLLEVLEAHEIVALHLVEPLADPRLRRLQFGDDAILERVHAAL